MEPSVLLGLCLYPHPPLHLSADLPFLLIKGMGVDVQRGGHLGVPQQPGNRSHIRPAGDHKAGRRMPQAVEIQVQGVFFKISLNCQVILLPAACQHLGHKMVEW